MKKFSFVAVAAAAGLLVSCQRPQSEPASNAEIEREVQQRIAADRQADEQQRLAQQQADLDAREQALADREAAANAPDRPTRPVAQTTATPRSISDASQPKSYDTFYRRLEPYGAWRETSEYGYVWQPAQAQSSRDWRPYADGRWGYTDAGWTWISEEPFGWATYHYGRWIRLRNVGWIWVPGEEWAPAWVSWRTSDQYVGWAPLPPEARFDRQRGIRKWADSYYDIDADEYVFVSNEEIGSPRLIQVVVPVERNVTIVNQTVNVTNITYNNVTVVNEGPNYEQLRARSRHPVERFRLERRFDAEGESPQAVVRGNVLAVTTPVFTAQTVERPRVVGEPIRQVTVERSWASSQNEPEAQRAREKMKSQATPPPDAPPKRFDKPKMIQATPASVAATSATPMPSVSAPASPRPELSPRVRQSATASQASTAIPDASAPSIASPTPRMSATPAPRPPAPPTATVSPLTTAPPVASGTISPHPSFTPRLSPSASPTPSSSPIPNVTAAPTSRVPPLATPRARTSPSMPNAPSAASEMPISDPDATGIDPESTNASGIRDARGRAVKRRENGQPQPLPHEPSRNPNPNRGGSPGVPADGSSSSPAASPMTSPFATPPLAARPRPAVPQTTGTPVPPAATPAQTPTPDRFAPAATTPFPRITPLPATTPPGAPTATAVDVTPSDSIEGAQNDPADSTRRDRNGRSLNRRPRGPVRSLTNPTPMPSATPQES